MTNGRLNIGLFICHLDNDYAYDICKGVDYAIKELDANLYIFPGMYINAAYNDPAKAKYDWQYNAAFYYASPANLDVLIVSIGTIGSFLSESDIKSFLDNFKEIPIITLEIPVEGYPYLYVESRTGLKNAITHLIDVHGKTKIGFVSGRIANQDAVERLNIYRETMKEHNLPVTEDMIVYGNFSEFCEEEVAALLDNNPDLEAIVFANDQMALGGYNEIKRRGLEIGKDILVTGYDNSAASLALLPNLTTVSAAVPDLGYQAAYEAVQLLKSGTTTKNVLNSSLIVRRSCGCTTMHACAEHKPESFTYKHKQLSDVVKDAEEILLRDFRGSYIYNTLYSHVHPILEEILKTTIHADETSYPEETIITLLNEMLTSRVMHDFTFDKCCYFFDEFETIALELIDNAEKKIAFLQLMNRIYAILNSRNSNLRYEDRKDYQLQVWSASYIARDTLNYGKDRETCFLNILDKLKDLKYDSSYLYLYDDPIMQVADGSWRVPENLILQAYMNEDASVVLPETFVASTDIFDNPYTPKNRRCTFILNPIFTNEQQHGIFVCEIDISMFNHIYSTDLQLGTALKFLNLIKTQMSTQNQLMLSLQEIHDKNDQLNHLSISDELTGLYNRRGFMESVKRQITSPDNAGKKAIIVYADMDNLKLVNDRFGHKNGDFALKSIANTLKRVFHDEDIIGRIGGDEFVAFAFLNQSGFIEELQHNLKQYSDEINETCGKPYYIDMSVGISEFTCQENSSLEDIMSEADAALYVNKKYKRISVLKD